MSFSSQIFLQELHTERFGRACRVVGETTSTIDLAWDWLRAGGPDGGMVIAERQTRGRGRLGREWASPEGGLWLSVIARPALAARQAGRLGMCMALAAAEAVREQVGCAAEVRWPNDIVVAGHKVGGVLVETEVRGESIAGAVLSLGLNVNLSAEDLPEAIRPMATSLWAETGQECALEVMAARVLESLERIWPLLCGDGRALAERWRELDLLAGAEVEVDVGEGRLRGRACGVDGEGALVLVSDGDVRRVSAGEVRGVRAERRC